MIIEAESQLTTKDHAILQTMLERYRGPHGPYLTLLEKKVRDSTIYFRDDIPPGVVTVNTRLTYRVGDVSVGPQLIVQSETNDLPPFALSIHTITGLALLGLAERRPVTIALGADDEETLQVEAILSQPEAEARLRERTADSPRQPQNVVSFPARRPQPVFEPDDDDPGPRAA